ncbi:MAG: NAD(P)H-dependent oxidoreductase subunit E [SAR324 cluster bacterium]|nr:NAD(P)H-dependent oxidoreductase subunit E [SAR324 cluster bacterium]
MNALLPILHLAQRENKGYLTPEWLEHVAEVCEVPATHVEGVATFYTMFKFRPLGKYHLQICTNIACGLCGGEKILEHVEQRLDLHAGHTREDGQFSIEEVECLGACGYGPVMIVNEEYHERLTVEATDKIIDELEKNTKELPEKILPLDRPLTA